MEHKTLVAHAKNIHRKGDVEGAKKIYRDVLNLDPKNWEALCFMGVAAQQQYNLDEARSHLEKAYKLAPNSQMVQANLANVIFLLKDYEKAQAIYEKLLISQPSNPTFLTNYGISLSDAENYEEALKFFDQAIAINPNNVETLSVRGALKANMGLLDGAIRDIKKLQLLPKENQEIERGSTSLIQHCVAMKLLSTFQVAQRRKQPLPDVKVSKRRNNKALDIVTFFIPPQENWREIKRVSHKTSWNFFLKTFYALAKRAAPHARVVLLTSHASVLPKDLPDYHIIRTDVSPDVLMYSRLICQINYMASRPPQTASFILDMDVLINQIPWGLVDSDVDVGLTTRRYMPPVNAGVMFLNEGDGSRKFLELTLAIYDKLARLAPSVPDLKDHDFKKWWGDQIAICGAAGILHSGMLQPTEYQLSESSFKLLDCEQYNYSPKAINRSCLEKDLSEKYFLHIKGKVTDEEINLLDQFSKNLYKTKS